MEPHELIRKIDDRLLYRISEGCSIEELIEQFTDVSKRCKKQSTFINVGLKYLINNWKFVDPNKKMNTLYVIFVDKRLKDLKWLLDNKHKFPHLQGEKLYNLLKLRDILNNK
jgi:hypothetical protein